MGKAGGSFRRLRRFGLSSAMDIDFWRVDIFDGFTPLHYATTTACAERASQGTGLRAILSILDRVSLYTPLVRLRSATTLSPLGTGGADDDTLGVSMLKPSLQRGKDWSIARFIFRSAHCASSPNSSIEFRRRAHLPFAFGGRRRVGISFLISGTMPFGTCSVPAYRSSRRSAMRF